MSSYPRSWTCANCASPYFSFALQVLLAGTFFAKMRETFFLFYTRRKGNSVCHPSLSILSPENFKWRIVNKFTFFVRSFQRQRSVNSVVYKTLTKRICFLLCFHHVTGPTTGSTLSEVRSMFVCFWCTMEYLVSIDFRFCSRFRSLLDLKRSTRPNTIFLSISQLVRSKLESVL